MLVRVLDLDNTISDDAWRQWLIDPALPDDDPRKYHAYHTLCDGDALINSHLLTDSPVPVVFVTSRPECVRAKTVAWLEQHPAVRKVWYGRMGLAMRPDDCHWPSHILKPRLLLALCKDLACGVEGVYDDREDVLAGYTSWIPQQNLHLVINTTFPTRLFL